MTGLCQLDEEPTNLADKEGSEETIKILMMLLHYCFRAYRDLSFNVNGPP
jgi:hypothetical protein